METPDLDSPHAPKPAGEFRDYGHARSRVEEFYALNHARQTLAFVLAKKQEYLSLNRKTMTVWEALEFLNTLVDDSDPDIDFTQIEHALQTAEAIRAANQPRWFIVTGLDSRSREDSVPVRRAAVGGRRRHTSRSAVAGLRKSFTAISSRDNPDCARAAEYQTECGIYEAGCGLDNVHHVVGARRVHLPRREGSPA